jgi:hypothetical protein
MRRPRVRCDRRGSASARRPVPLSVTGGAGRKLSTVLGERGRTRLLLGMPSSSGPSLGTSLAEAGCDLRNRLVRLVRSHAFAWSGYGRRRALILVAVGWKWQRRWWAVLVILIVQVNAAAAVGGMALSVLPLCLSAKSVRAV